VAQNGFQLGTVVYTVSRFHWVVWFSWSNERLSTYIKDSLLLIFKSVVPFFARHSVHLLNTQSCNSTINNVQW